MRDQWSFSGAGPRYRRSRGSSAPELAVVVSCRLASTGQTMLFFPRLKRNGSLARHRPPGRQRFSVELLEDRTVPSGGGITPSLVALGGATPTPIPLSAASLFHDSADIGGPDIYLNLPGPVTAPAS